MPLRHANFLVSTYHQMKLRYTRDQVVIVCRRGEDDIVEHQERVFEQEKTHTASRDTLAPRYCVQLHNTVNLMYLVVFRTVDSYVRLFIHNTGFGQHQLSWLR